LKIEVGPSLRHRVALTPRTLDNLMCETFSVPQETRDRPVGPAAAGDDLTHTTPEDVICIIDHAPVMQGGGREVPPRIPTIAVASPIAGDPRHEAPLLVILTAHAPMAHDARAVLHPLIVPSGDASSDVVAEVLAWPGVPRT